MRKGLNIALSLIVLSLTKLYDTVPNREGKGERRSGKVQPGRQDRNKRKVGTKKEDRPDQGGKTEKEELKEEDKPSWKDETEGGAKRGRQAQLQCSQLCYQGDAST